MQKVLNLSRSLCVKLTSQVEADGLSPTGSAPGIQEKTASPHSSVVTVEPWGFIINYIHKNVSGYMKSKMELK